MSSFAPPSATATETIAAPPAEQPLPAARYGLFLSTATLLIAAFYLYSALFLVVGSLLWLLVLILGIVGSQYGGLVVGWPVLNALGASLKTFASGLRLGRGVDFHLKLEREQAPKLWEVVEDLSKQLAVVPPREYVLESGVNAYVMLRGVAAGRGKTRLGVGFDLLAGLSEAQARAVMAHEIAHAKYVRRGYQGFLMRGLVRLSRCAGALESIATHEENHRAARAVSRWIGALPGQIARVAGKLIAACSRYDEFLADRVAAEICGPTPCQTALLATHVLDYQADKIDYRERLLHLEREPGYAQWLRGRLRVEDEARRAELEARALERAHRHELSTHPALPDRLAAIDNLGNVAAPNQNSAGAETGLVWLQKPDEVAGLLLRHIEKTAADEEARATKSLAKWMRKRERERRGVWNNAGLVAFACLILGLAMLGVLVGLVGELRAMPGWWREPESWATTLFMVGVVGFLLGVPVLHWRKTATRAGELPIPPFALYRQAQLRARERGKIARELAKEREARPANERHALEVADEEERARKRIVRGAGLRAALPAAATKPAERARFRIGQGYEALARGDYESAAHCARLVFELDSARGEALLMRAICVAGRGGWGEIGALENAALPKLGASGQWGVAWISCLNGETGAGEAFLLELVRRKPRNATLRALLGFCQAANGKPREALASRKTALELARADASLSPTIGEAEETCHRFVLLQNLTMLGQLGDAQVELEWLNAYRARVESEGGQLIGLDTFALDLENLRWQVARGHHERALEWASQMSRSQTVARGQIEIGDALAGAREEPLRATAKACYERALENGFYPQVKVALSRLAYDREDRAGARALLLEALDCTRPRPHDAAHPLSQMDEVLSGLRAIDDAAPARVEGWEVELDCPKMGLDAKQLFLLCLLPDEATAQGAAHEIFAALLPGQEWQDKVKTARAPERYQPDEPMAPGIYGSRWIEE